MSATTTLRQVLAGAVVVAVADLDPPVHVFEGPLRSKLSPWAVTVEVAALADFERRYNVTCMVMLDQPDPAASLDQLVSTVRPWLEAALTATWLVSDAGDHFADETAGAYACRFEVVVLDDSEETVTVPGPIDSYTFVQSTPADVWTIDHDLGVRPAHVTLTDANGEEIAAEVAHPSLVTTVITFTTPVAGTARLI